MRVLYFSKSYTPHDHRFLTSLSGEGYQVYFLQLEKQNKVLLEERSLPDAVELLSWESGRNVNFWSLQKNISNFRKIVEKIKPDIVHAGPIQSAGLIAALSGFHPLVTMSWAYDLLIDVKRGNFFKTSAKYTLKNSDRMVADCDTIADIAAGFGLERERIVKFPWGIDLKKFTPGRNEALRKKLGWDNEIVLLHLRSWEPIYGVDVLIKGFIKAVKQEPRLRLLMLGGGSQESEIKNLLHQANVTEKVKFVGYFGNEELPDYYKAADIYVSASHSDGSSVSLMEAMASGLPTIVSDIPGNKEWVREGKQGWLFTDGSPSSLAEKVLEAASKADDLDSFGKKNRKIAEERADWPKNFKILTQAYEELYKEANG